MKQHFTHWFKTTTAVPGSSFFNLKPLFKKSGSPLSCKKITFGVFLWDAPLYSWEQVGLSAEQDIGCLRWESPRKFYPRAAPSLKWGNICICCSLEGSQVLPALLGLPTGIARADGRIAAAKGRAGAVQSPGILSALWHCHRDRRRDIEWVLPLGGPGAGGAPQSFGAPKCYFSRQDVWLVYFCRAGCLQKSSWQGEKPKDRLSHCSQSGFARQWDGIQLLQPHPCRISCMRLKIPRAPPEGSFSGKAMLPAPRLIVLFPLSGKKVA